MTKWNFIDIYWLQVLQNWAWKSIFCARAWFLRSMSYIELKTGWPQKNFIETEIVEFQLFCRPTDLRLKSVVQASKRPSPSPTRRQSQPAAPPGYGGSPVRVRRGSNPTTPTGLSSKPVYESVPSSAYLPPAVSASPTRYPRSRSRHKHYHHHRCYYKSKTNPHRDYSSESEIKASPSKRYYSSGSDYYRNLHDIPDTDDDDVFRARFLSKCCSVWFLSFL